MRLFKRIILSFCASLVTNVVSAQLHGRVTAENNIFKYWTYQNKLEKYFMTAPGDSYLAGSGLPASFVRGVSGCPDEDSYIKWGDAPIDLAWYIGALAIEYSLLKNCGERTENVVKKLYEELSTINRLDAFAEFREIPPLWPNPELEGYFMRDDVVTTDVVNWTISTPGRVYESYDSDYKNSTAFSHPQSIQESQDQIVHLLMGLKCIVDLVPDNEMYYINGNPVAFELDVNDGSVFSIRQEARRITDRLVYWARDPESWLAGDTPNGWSWNIMDHSIIPLGFSVHQGSDAWWLSIGFDQTQEAITGSSTPGPRGPTLINGLDFTHVISWFFATQSWKFIRNNGIPFFPDEDYMPQMLAAMSDSWYSSKNFNAWNHALRGLGTNYIHIPLFYSTFYDAPLYVPDQLYWLLFNMDLKYTGACYLRGPGYEYYPSPFWSSSQRFLHPERVFPGHNDFPGIYNNLDYMFCYNLYYLKYKDGMPPYLNGYNAFISSLVTFPYHGYGTISTPYTVNAIENIDAENYVSSNTVVEYQAGVSIELLPGFSTDYNSNFVAQIVPFVESGLWGNCPEPRLANPYGNSQNDLNEEYTEKNFENNVSVSPNPFTNEIDIKLIDGKNSYLVITLFDQFGHEIVSLDRDKILEDYYSKKITLENVSSGTYFLRIILDDQKVINKKLIKL